MRTLSIILLVVWVAIVGGTSYAIGHAWGIAAQMIWLAVSFLLSIALGVLSARWFE